MIVYAESNFVLELVFLQEQHEACEQILRLAEAGSARLFLPAFSLAEPHETLIRRDKRRQSVAEQVATEIRELGRSKPYKDETNTSQSLLDLLTKSGAEEKSRLASVQVRLLGIAATIPLEAKVLAAASKLQERHDLSPQDAMVLASVLSHLNGSDSCFLNRNSKDFSDPDIVDVLAGHKCKMLFNFDQGYNYIGKLTGE